MVQITMGKIRGSNLWYAFQYGKKILWSKSKTKLINRIRKYKEI